jgi:translocation and assembly module TamB
MPKLRGVARAAAAGAVAASVVAVALPLSLRLPRARRLVAAKVNGVLASTFVGHVVVDQIGELGITHAGGIDAHVEDADGTTLLRVEGARARLSTWALVRSVIGGHGEIVVDVPELTLGRVDATIDPDATGALRIARAFELRPDAARNQSPGRGARVTVPRIFLAHADVHVRPNAAPPLEAEVDGAEASLRLAGRRLSLDVDRAPIVVRGLPGGVRAQGEIEAHLTQPSLRVRVLWNGAVGTIADRVEATYDDGRVDAVADVARATPEQLRAAWPDCPISVPMEAHAEVHGTLPLVDISAHVVVGAASLDVSGPVVVRPEVRAKLHFEGQALDVQAIVPSAPPSDLEASGDVEVNAKPSGAVDGRGNIVLASGRLGSTRIPGATLTAQFERSAEGDVSARGELALREPAATTVVTIQLEPKDGVPIANFEADTSITRLDEAAFLERAASGTANVHAAGSLNLRTNAIDARASATFGNLRARGASLRSAHVELHATGNLRAPSVGVVVDGEGLEAGGANLSAVRAVARVTADGGLALHDVELDATGTGEPARARAALVQISSNSLSANDVLIEGLGDTLTAAWIKSPSTVVVKVKSDGLDLARLSTFTTLATARGKLALDVDATVKQGAAEGRFSVDLQHAAYSGLGDASARIDVTIDGRQASGRATASIDDIGTIQLESSSVYVGTGPLLTASPWRKAWGTVEFDARVDLARLAARLPRIGNRFDGVQGTLESKGLVSRDTGDDATPRVEVAAHTSGLVLVGRSASGTAPPSAGAGAGSGPEHAWRIAGVDPVLHVTVDGNTGNTAVQAQIGDTTGTMLEVDAKSDAVPYAILFSDESPREALLKMPFDARIAVPARPLASYPPSWGIGAIGGELRGAMSWHGSILSPTIDGSASLVGGNAFPSILAFPLDLTVGVHYDGAKFETSLQAAARSRSVVTASATILANAPDIVAGLTGTDIPWVASASANLDRLPLRGISLLDDSQVRGTVSGQLSVDGLHSDARAKLALDFAGLEVGGVPCRSSRVEATVDGHALDATARLDQADGFVEGHARAGVHWGRANAPTLDLSQSAETSLNAKQFRAAFLLPFVSPWLSALDGRIDADAHVEFAPGGSVRPEGTISLDNGAFQLTSFGGPFHGASAKLTLRPDGVVFLKDAVAKGITGTVQSAASARFTGGALGAIRASLRIPSKDPLPLVFDGVQMGMLDGDFAVAVDRSAANRRLDVVVDVPSAHVELPSGTSSLDVQSLGPVPGVRVGLRPAAGKFVEAPLNGPRDSTVDSTHTRGTSVQIGLRMVDMRVSRGTDLDVRLEGQPTITLDGKTKVAGQIRMPRGSIDVLGKPFAIDHGTVTFVGDDPTNPQILLTATWTAPDLTRVYADFVGPLRTGKVKLRAEPARSESEIVALILFGTTDEQSAQANSQISATSPMAGAAGGAATQPLNRALGGVDRALQNMGLAGGISTKIDTSQTTPRPEVEVQIARDISLQIAWVLGAPPPGTNPDSALLTLNWHFLRKWSLETTVGDAGTSIVDLVWQHRY